MKDITAAEKEQMADFETEMDDVHGHNSEGCYGQGTYLDIHQPDTPAHPYLRLDAGEVKNAETEMVMRSCITSLNAAEARYYGGYQY